MRRAVSMLTVLAILVIIVGSALPAMAKGGSNDWRNNGSNWGNSNWHNWNWNNWNWHNWNRGNNGFFNTPSVSNGVAQESQTGNVTENFSVDQSGSNSNQCVTPQQFANTGSQQNAQPILQYNSLSGNIEPEGSNFTFAPELTAPCTQQVQQSAAASGN